MGALSKAQLRRTYTRCYGKAEAYAFAAALTPRDMVIEGVNFREQLEGLAELNKHMAVEAEQAAGDCL